MDRFLLMTCFARSVELGSLSAAGRDLGLSQPNVSRYVAALEEHLQIRLLHRSTRKLSLTQEGERYYADCLLYTSPSPRDQRGSRMPSSA